MCGIVGGIAGRDVTPILLQGLQALEYRGYDSSGLLVLDADARLHRRRASGKLSELIKALQADPLVGAVGIGHTRWATHGKPTTANAHPHMSGERVALVHNGIIENHAVLRAEQKALGHVFTSETDTEVIVHLIHDQLKETGNLLSAVQASIARLQGAYALAVVCTDEPDRLIAVKQGSPVVIGVGVDEHFIASDVQALLAVTRRFIFLEEGDVADIRRSGVEITNREGERVERSVRQSALSPGQIDKAGYKHFMEKEIHEQPAAIAETLEGRVHQNDVLMNTFGPDAEALLQRVQRVQILACGTSYHAGMVARYWLEAETGLPCQVEVASEFRYRDPVLEAGTLVITLSQSGETADTLAALCLAQQRGALASLAICNVPESSLVRQSDLVLMTRAGPEIGVASTKAFTTQLVALLILVMGLGRISGKMTAERRGQVIQALKHLPAAVEQLLAELDAPIAHLAGDFADKHHALFLGRGAQYPIAQEGALKLKEISYIHAEAYPAGELKHGPLALVDAEMPVIAVAPNNRLLEKLLANFQEVTARGGQLYVFADDRVTLAETEDAKVLFMPTLDDVVSPILFAVPLQLLAYHVALIKGTDVDQPRNLAKSVTVE